MLLETPPECTLRFAVSLAAFDSMRHARYYDHMVIFRYPP
jgi:hypothetical protein